MVLRQKYAQQELEFEASMPWIQLFAMQMWSKRHEGKHGVRTQAQIEEALQETHDVSTTFYLAKAMVYLQTMNTELQAHLIHRVLP